MTPRTTTTASARRRLLLAFTASGATVLAGCHSPDTVDYGPNDRAPGLRNSRDPYRYRQRHYVSPYQREYNERSVGR